MLIRERRRNRLKNFDYSSFGYYFVTICTKNRQEYFGEIKNRRMVLNTCGEIVRRQWLWLENHFPFIKLDEWIIMPNHVHAIVIIQKQFTNIEYSPVGTTLGLSLQMQHDDNDMKYRRIQLLPKIICALKTTTSKLIHQLGVNSFKWQRSFYDHIIRNEKSLFAIRQYIRNNPLRWEEDRNNPENLLM